MNGMDQQIKVYDVNEDELLNRFGMDRRQIDDYQVLCLPENFREASSKDDLYDTHDSVALFEQLRNAGLKSANTSDLSLNPRNQYAVRKSFDILWLGVLSYVQRAERDGKLSKARAEQYRAFVLFGRIPDSAACPRWQG